MNLPQRQRILLFSFPGDDGHPFWPADLAAGAFAVYIKR